jgi:hypothetical protein
MTLDQLFALFARARELSGHRDFVVIGSLSILAFEAADALPEDMTLSNDIDAYTKEDPPRIFDLQAALGADSSFHESEGYFLDPVSPHLPTLPDGWESRLVRIERNGLRVWFLEPNDAAISKYARGEPRDERWIRSGILNGYISLPTVLSRLPVTSFLDEEESREARRRFEADRAWFESIKTGRRRKLRAAE